MELRPANSEADLAAYIAVWNAVTPEEPSDLEQQRRRRERDSRRLYLVAAAGDEVVGCGFAGPSNTPDRGFLQPRVLPHARRSGVGSALLAELQAHLESVGFESASSHVGGTDEASLAFAARHGYEEVDRQVEQVKSVGDEPAATVPEGVVLATLAQRAELLRASYDLAVEGYADMATYTPVTITLDDWLEGDDADVGEGSYVALSGDEIVGFSGLCQTSTGAYEDGLTVVRRDWRRRGLAEALKRAKLAWAAENGITEITTWTQRGNEGMRALNERLGYTYRSVSVSVRTALRAPR